MTRSELNEGAQPEPRLARKEAGRPPRRSGVHARTLPALSLYNAREPLRIVARRMAARPARYPEIAWRRWLFICLALAAVCLVLVDPLAGAQWSRWPVTPAAIANRFTQLGLGQWYIVPPVILLLAANLVDWHTLSRRRLRLFYNWTCMAFFLLSATGISGLIVLLFKNVIGRARPIYFETLGVFAFHPLALDARFASFPSGHATIVGAVAGVLYLLFPKWRYVTLLFAVWVAATRVLVGAHYPSDTVVGFGLGFGCAVALAVFFARLGFIFVQRPAGLPVRKKTFRLT